MVCYFQRNNLAETKKFSRVERQSNLCNAKRREKKIEFRILHASFFFCALRDSPETDLRSTMCGHCHQPFSHYVSTTRKFNFNKCEKRNKNAFCSPMLSIRRIFACSFFSIARSRTLLGEENKNINLVEIPTTCELAISFRLYNAIDFITLYLGFVSECVLVVRIRNLWDAMMTFQSRHSLFIVNWKKQQTINRLSTVFQLPNLQRIRHRGINKKIEREILSSWIFSFFFRLFVSETSRSTSYCDQVITFRTWNE